jgi:hypothetical protein
MPEYSTVIFPAIHRSYDHLCDLRDTFFVGTRFRFQFLSAQIGRAWNDFAAAQSAPISFDNPEEDRFPPFSEFYRCQTSTFDNPTEEIFQSAEHLLQVIAPFALLLPPDVLPLWDSFGNGTEIPIIEGPISQAVENLRKTIRPIARDAGIAAPDLMRLDALLRLPQIISRIRADAKTRTDDFPVDVTPVYELRTELGIGSDEEE